ncbi:MAG: SRPBCC family protein [Acidobacteriota bacterium]|nr:SRPBCC family protein [Acidobacteriota bacterium]
MDVDVLSEIVIRRPKVDVAGYSANPDNAPKWYVNIKNVEWVTPPPLRVGSRITFVAQFLGRKLVYTYAAEGPFPMETTYTWESVLDGSTRMTLRNRGTPSGFSRLVAPLIARAMRRANRKDLARLKENLESR